MALPTATAPSSATIVPRDQKDPAYAGKYGYRALGAYSSGLDSGGQPVTNTAYNPTGGGINTGALEDAVKQAIYDPLKMPNRVVDKAIQGTNRIIDKGIQGAGQRIENAAQTVGELPKRPVSTVNKILGTHTVICTELHRQGRVGDHELRLARVYRKRHLPSEHLYAGYLLWATPVVRGMRSSKTFNRAVMPFAMALVRQWCDIATGKPGTLFQKIVYRLAWGASSLAYHIEEQRRDWAARLEYR